MTLDLLAVFLILGFVVIFFTLLIIKIDLKFLERRMDRMEGIMREIQSSIWRKG